MKRLSLAVCALALFAARASAATMTLEGALTRALDANPSITRAKADVDAARARRRLARSAILPRLDLDASTTRFDREITFDLNGTTVTLQPSEDRSATLTLRQPLYAGGRELKAIRQTALAIEAADAAMKSTEDAVLFRTAFDYLALVESEALIDVERQNVAVAAGRRDLAAKMFKAGEFTSVDVLRADAAQKAAERGLAAAEQQRQEAESFLRVDVALDEEISVVAPDLSLPPMPDLSELTATSLASRPDMKRALAVYEVARLETRKQRAARLPVVTLEGKLSRQRADFPSDETRSIAVSLHLPIFDSGEISSRIAMAAEQETKASTAVAELKQSISEELVRAVAGLETARKNLELARQQLAASEGEYKQISSLYRSQEATSLDIDTAESSLAEARRTVVIGSLEAKLAELRVWYAAGTLKSTLLPKEN